MADPTALPPGFTLDQPSAPTAASSTPVASLPPGFTLDQPAAEPGALDVAGQAAVKGLHGAVKAVSESTSPFADHPQETPDTSYVGKLLAQPLSEGWKNPKWWVANSVAGLAESAPTVGGAVLGGIGGAAAGSAVPVVGTAAGGVAGAAAGGAAGAMIQTLAPAYQRARADGLDHQESVDRAWKESGIAAAGGALMGLSPELKLFGTTVTDGVAALKRPIGEALAEIFAKQPAIGIAQQAATNAAEGKGTSLDEAGKTYAMTVLPGAAMTAGHRAISARANKDAAVQPPETASESEPSAAPPVPVGPVKATYDIPTQQHVVKDSAGTIIASGLTPETAEARAAEINSAQPQQQPPAQPKPTVGTADRAPQPLSIDEQISRARTDQQQFVNSLDLSKGVTKGQKKQLQALYDNVQRLEDLKANPPAPMPPALHPIDYAFDMANKMVTPALPPPGATHLPALDAYGADGARGFTMGERQPEPSPAYIDAEFQEIPPSSGALPAPVPQAALPAPRPSLPSPGNMTPMSPVGQAVAGPGFTIGAPPAGTPLARALASVSGLSAGDEIRPRQLAAAVGLRGAEQTRTLMDRLSTRGVAERKGDKWVRTTNIEAPANPTTEVSSPSVGPDRAPQPESRAEIPAAGSGYSINPDNSVTIGTSTFRGSHGHPFRDRSEAEAFAQDRLGRTGSRDVPAPTDDAGALQAARDRVAPEPSQAQIAANNYQKGHVRFEGLPITIENPVGSKRRGVDPNGNAWETTLPADYGYIKGTTGRDGDHVDVYIGPDSGSRKVFVFDQIDPATGKFDEHKTVLGASDERQATAIYDAAFSDGSGPERRGAMTAMDIDEFKGLLQGKDGHLKRPLAWKNTAMPDAPAAKRYRPAVHTASYGSGGQQKGILMRARARLSDEFGKRVEVQRRGDQWRLTIKGASEAEDAKAMAEINRQIQITLDKSQRGRERGAPQRGPLSLNEWIAKNGGIVDDGGDLASAGLDRWHIGHPGMPRLTISANANQKSILRDQGRSYNDRAADVIAQDAIEAGYLPPESDGEALKEAMLRDQVRPVHTPDGEAFQADKKAKIQAERDHDKLLAKADELEIDTAGMRPEDIEKAVSLSERNEADFDAIQAAEDDALLRYYGGDEDLKARKPETDHGAEEIPFEPLAKAAAQDLQNDERQQAVGENPRAGQEGSRVDEGRTGLSSELGHQQVGPITEKVQTVDGTRDQVLIPGVKPVTDRQRIEAQSDKPIRRGGNAPADFGLFDTGARKQGDMIDLLKQQEKEPPVKSEKSADVPALDHGMLNVPLGLKDLPTLRAALREYLDYRGAAPKADPIKSAERALVGRKIPGYFPTPDETVRRMVDMADIRPGMTVLEPSAGKGSIADRVAEVADPGALSVIEPVSDLRSILEAKGHSLVDHDFLEHQGRYDRMVMNPPFEDRQDVAHVQHAYDLLKPGGRVVAIMSEGPFFGGDKRAVEFRDWLDRVGGISERLPDRTFMDSDRPTGVATRLVTIDKAADGDVPFHRGEPVTTRPSRKTGQISYDGAQLDAPDSFFSWMNIPKHPLWADYNFLSRKHAEWFSSGEQAREFVERVLTDADEAIPSITPGHMQVIRRVGFGELVAVDLREKGGRYEVESAYPLDPWQLEHKEEKARQAGQPILRRPTDTGSFRRSTDDLSGEPIISDTEFSSNDVGDGAWHREYLGGGAHAFTSEATVGARAQASTQLNEIIGRTAGDNIARVKVVDHILTPDGKGAYGAFPRHGGTVYVGLRDMQRMAETANHEAVHLMRQVGLLDGKPWEVLERAAEADWRQRFNIDRAYAADVADWRAHGLSDEQINARLNEEAIAHASSEFGAGRLDAQGFKAQALHAVQQVIEAIRNLVSGHGFRTAYSTLRDLHEGKFAEPNTLATYGRAPLPGHVAAATALSRGADGFVETNFQRSTPEERLAVKELLTHKVSQRAGEMISSARDALGDIGREIVAFASPMAKGSDVARKSAKDFANAVRLARYQLDQFNSLLTKQFSDKERRAMWEAMDEASVTAQRMMDEGKTREEAVSAVRADSSQGINRLPPVQRQMLDALSDYAGDLWGRAVDAGMVKGDGLPFWTPRVGVMIGEDGTFGRLESGYEGAPTLDTLGRNLTTTSPNLKGRKHLTAEETEAAMKAKFGDKAELVRDIRAMPIAMGRLERAVAGKELVNRIKEIGEKAGAETVSDTEKTGFFTLDHPSFKTYKPRMKEVPVSADELAARDYHVIDGSVFARGRDEPRLLSSYQVDRDGKVTDLRPVLDAEGRPVFDKVPLYIHQDFEGPLKAVLTRGSGPVYRALMGIKGKAMGLIMYSPLIHNGVIWGKALPAMPGKVATFRIYSDGAAAKSSPETMREAINAGVVPINRHYAYQDMTGVLDGDNLKPGRSVTAKAIGGAVGMVSERAGEAVKRGIDQAGDFWHSTLLWDRISDLQMGMYVNLRDKLKASSFSDIAAQRTAAHEANRFAGILPAEAMGELATKLANVGMFSRSFTLGNLSIMKDMLVGMPSDVLAQLKSEVGTAEAKKASDFVRHKGRAALVMDIALFYGANAILQNAIQLMGTGGAIATAAGGLTGAVVGSRGGAAGTAIGAALGAGMGAAGTSPWWNGTQTASQVAQGYVDRLGELLHSAKEHPIDLLNPFWLADRMSPTFWNEPGRQDRILIGADSKGTSIYMRNPSGKVGEEFKGWLTNPFDMMSRKLSTIVKPSLEVFTNSDYFGHHVYDKEAEGLEGWARNAGKIAWHLLSAQEPQQAVEAIAAMTKDSGDQTVNALKAFGPMAGVTFSKGYPGGPVAGQIAAINRRKEEAIKDAIPEAKQMVEKGNAQGAIESLVAAGMDLHQAKAFVKHQINPSSRVTSTKVGKASRAATPDERARIERDLTNRPATLQLFRQMPFEGAQRVLEGQ